MNKLWEFDNATQQALIELSLKKHGLLIGKMSSPHSSIFTFDNGASSQPRYVVAKALQVSAEMGMEDKRKFFARVLYEVNNAYAVCHHPSIQRFSDIQVIYGVPFLLAAKRDATLRDIIAEEPLTESEALSIAIQLVHALAYCTMKGIVCHQDLKPENIFIDSFRNHFSVPDDYPLRFRVYVADFELSNAYMVLRRPYGSRPYMAPEQYEKLFDTSLPDFSRTDVFAIGVMLFEMLTGGIHPIGEQTSLIWPSVAEGKSRMWLREDKWKRWAKKGLPALPVDCRISPEMRLIIEGCLKTDFSERLSKEGLEVHLLERLRLIDRNAFDTLLVTQAYFDQVSNESEKSGWPYYDDLIEKLNAAFSDSTSL
jgi:serine/threonine protein kinase